MNTSPFKKFKCIKGQTGERRRELTCRSVSRSPQSPVLFGPFKNYLDVINTSTRKEGERVFRNLRDVHHQ